MNILVRNNTTAPNKYVRLLKWKLYNLAEKFKNLLYVEAFIDSEGQNPIEYQIKIRLGVPGHDLIISKKMNHLEKLIHTMEQIAHSRLASNKERMPF